jgi:hypothetical protein
MRFCWFLSAICCCLWTAKYVLFLGNTNTCNTQASVNVTYNIDLCINLLVLMASWPVTEKINNLFKLTCVFCFFFSCGVAVSFGWAGAGKPPFLRSLAPLSVSWCGARCACVCVFACVYVFFMLCVWFACVYVCMCVCVHVCVCGLRVCVICVVQLYVVHIQCIQLYVSM